MGKELDLDDVVEQSELATRELQEIQECINMAAIFYDDVIKQIGNICIQDYQNLNELGILLRKLRTKQ